MNLITGTTPTNTLETQVSNYLSTRVGKAVTATQIAKATGNSTREVTTVLRSLPNAERRSDTVKGKVYFTLTQAQADQAQAVS